MHTKLENVTVCISFFVGYISSENYFYSQKSFSMLNRHVVIIHVE